MISYEDSTNHETNHVEDKDYRSYRVKNGYVPNICSIV